MTPKNVNANEPTGNPVLIGQVLREMYRNRFCAEVLVRSGHPVVAEILEMGRREGVPEGERNAGDRAEHTARDFLDYLGDCPDVPDLDLGPATGPEDAS